jgi:hypothetical protein
MKHVYFLLLLKKCYTFGANTTLFILFLIQESNIDKYNNYVELPVHIRIFSLLQDL